MQKIIFFFFAGGIFVLIILGAFLFSRSKMETVKICFSERCFLAEAAKTKAQRTKGLMFRESLAEDQAMFFVFEKPGVYNFWMKNCKIPLDIIWLDENYKVVAIKPNNQPCETSNCPSIQGVFAKYVVEINAGLAAQIGISEGSYFSVQK